MNTFTYRFAQANKQITIRVINLNNIVDCLFQKNDLGQLQSIQCLTNAPTTKEWEAVPNRIKYDKTGKIALDKKGQQEIQFSHKEVHKHIICSIVEKEDMIRFMELLGVTETFEFAEPVELVPELEIEIKQPELFDTESQTTA